MKGHFHKFSNDMLGGGSEHAYSMRIQPLNILTVYSVEIFLGKSVLVTSKLRTSTSIKILKCDAFSHMQIRKWLFYPICRIVFICFYSFLSSFIFLPTVVVVSVNIFCSRESDGRKESLSSFSISETWDFCVRLE